MYESIYFLKIKKKESKHFDSHSTKRISESSIDSLWCLTFGLWYKFRVESFDLLDSHFFFVKSARTINWKIVIDSSTTLTAIGSCIVVKADTFDIQANTIVGAIRTWTSRLFTCFAFVADVAMTFTVYAFAVAIAIGDFAFTYRKFALVAVPHSITWAFAIFVFSVSVTQNRTIRFKLRKKFSL
jgi:hypothetical protein